jgi:hypothetical protein
MYFSCNALGFAMQIQKPVDVYRKRAYALAAFVCVLQTAAFVAMYVLLDSLTGMVKTLTSIGEKTITVSTLHSLSFSTANSFWSIPYRHANCVLQLSNA